MTIGRTGRVEGVERKELKTQLLPQKAIGHVKLKHSKIAVQI